MKVFLKRDVPGLGKANEVKNVSDGYARNYLIPRGLAIAASDGNIKAARDFAETQKAREERIRAHSLEIAEKLKNSPLRLKAKAGDTGRLYGSITSSDIADAVGRVLGGKFDKRQILLDRPIRDTGSHTVEIKLDGGVRGHVQVIVDTED